VLSITGEARADGVRFVVHGAKEYRAKPDLFETVRLSATLTNNGSSPILVSATDVGNVKVVHLYRNGVELKPEPYLIYFEDDVNGMRLGKVVEVEPHGTAKFDLNGLNFVVVHGDLSQMVFPRADPGNYKCILEYAFDMPGPYFHGPVRAEVAFVLK
jgi:hypothetical protein